MSYKNNTQDLSEYIGKAIKVKFTLDHYTYPKVKKDQGPLNFSIIRCYITEVIEGEVPACFLVNPASKTYSITLCGYGIPTLQSGEEYIGTVKMKFNQKYNMYEYTYVCGEMEFDRNKVEDPRDVLKYFLTDREVNLLVDNLADPLKVLETDDIASLTTIPHVGPASAKKYCQRYHENYSMLRAFNLLGEFQLSMATIKTLLEHYGSPDVVVDIVKNNPYVLITEVTGFGWKKADRIALSAGYTKDGKERVLAYAHYYLEQQGQLNGNSCIKASTLIDEVCVECYPIDRATATSYIHHKCVEASTFEEEYRKHTPGKKDCRDYDFFYDNESKEVGLLSTRFLERDIFNELNRLMNAKPLFSISDQMCLDAIKQTEAQQSFEYTQEQVAAINMTMKNNVSIITGFPGCGKSSTLKPLVATLKNAGKIVAQTALSGRASSLLTEVTHLEGKTIHRLLCFTGDRFQINANNPLNCDVVILDEASMVDEELFYSLISSIKTGAKFIMVGDVHQLPPIGVGSVFFDCLRSGYVPSISLTKIHRQAARSGIITESAKVCLSKQLIPVSYKGEEIRGELKDLKIIGVGDKDILRQKILTEFHHIHDDLNVPYCDIQIIAPLRVRGNISCYSLNTEIQDIVNPMRHGKKECIIHRMDGTTQCEIHYREGDRVMVTVNTYNILDTEGNQRNIFNGNFATITSVGKQTVTIRPKDQDYEIVLRGEDLSKITLAYAASVHRCQGSGFPYIIVALDFSAYSLLSRELVYTAMTRATKYCCLAVESKALAAAIRMSCLKEKATWLRKDFIAALKDGVIKQQKSEMDF